MMQIINCIRFDHDYTQLTLAVIVCVVGSFITMRMVALVSPARTDLERRVWGVFAAICLGSTAWSTHFLAMLAFEVPVASGFYPGSTIGSLLFAIAGSQLVMVVYSVKSRKPFAELAGVLFGLTLAGTHYIGMQSYWVSGDIRIDVNYQIGGDIGGVVLGALAFSRAKRPITRYCRSGAATALILSIVVLHFTDMAGITIDPRAYPVPEGVFVGSGGELLISGLVAFITAIVLLGAWISRLAQRQMRSNYEGQLEHMALHDSLTGAANRYKLEREFNRLTETRKSYDHIAGLVSEVHQTPEKMAIACIDLDGFKALNDRFGHVVGDQALVKITENLKAEAPNGTIVARTGGDEFFCLCPATNSAELKALGAKLSEAVKIEGSTQDGHYRLGASIGIATFPDHGTELAPLMNKADMAMYRAKADLKSSILFYDESHDLEEKNRRMLLQEIRDGMERSEFRLHYQVQSNIHDGSPTGHEALIRWQHPRRGLLSPYEFIPEAERSGLIVKLGRWVVEEACRQAAAMPELGTVAVNVSPLQLEDEG
ncbi:MAG: diguanylate cyclase, partial [Pseudomonadota bacterium]